jgi:hypothetical protein
MSATTKPAEKAAVIKEAAELTKREAIKEIAGLHTTLCGLARQSAEKAIRIGEILAAQKAKLPHGRWEDFILSELPFTARTASNYLRVYRKFKIGNVSDLRLTQIYGLLREPKEESTTARETSPKTEPDHDVENLIESRPSATEPAKKPAAETTPTYARILVRLRRLWELLSREDQERFFQWTRDREAKQKGGT